MDPKRPLIEALESEFFNKEDTADYHAAVKALTYLIICMYLNIMFAISHLLKWQSLA